MKKLICVIALALACASAQCADKTMAELNPDFEGRIQKAIETNGTKPFVLYHISDMHSDGGAFARLVAFYETYEKYFDGAICTGDLVGASYVSDFDYWANTPGHEKIMNIIGNHDTLRDHGDWRPGTWENQITMREAYDRYMGPFIKKWNVVYEEGKTYYFKDYNEKKVRLICIDCMLRNSKEPEAQKAQLQWFKECLMGAKVKGYSVVAATHFQMRNAHGLKCNFTEASLEEGAWYEELNAYQAAVDRFMKTGGDFVCWIGGHGHWDYIATNPAYPEQYDICIAAACGPQCEAYSTMKRTPGTKDWDLANAFIVDTDKKVVKLIRIGCDHDATVSDRHEMEFNYKTKEILKQH